ncbi:hypothetical protein CLG85_006485 [Yangia mangrovi]|uniref:DoxX family protein n=2 Tax=Alloyangia mangrovi TaxID=1779329 RepID=A0ABT2KI04_9RHOB|nr:hypothetical protein [Alloyangia mangrovi]MCT4369998.1 hypothetical protein [Alloyangia mangrovi]
MFPTGPFDSGLTSRTMVSFFPTFQCALRILFALLLGHTVALEIFTDDPVLTGALDVRMPGPLAALICAVLASISIWLILGVATRTVALSGFAIYLCHELLLPDFTVFDLETAQRVIVVALLALPLVIFGGGRFSVISPHFPETV